MKFVLLVMALFISAIANADYTYDSRTGNSYYTTPGLNGGATVRGYNTNNGSSWSTRIDSGGNMNGMDAKGNYWNYNKSTGSYWNSNGTTCFGQGASRVCN